MDNRSPNTEQKEPVIDSTAVAKEKGKLIDAFFENLKEVGDLLSAEDLDVAIHSLKVAGLEIKEREKRKKAEEEARLAEQKRAEEQKRRELAAQRAARRAEKKHREHVAEVTRMDLPMDFVNSYDEDERASFHVESIADGLMTSLDMLGLVDIEFISSVTGADYKTVIETLRGSIYQNPLHWNECFYKGWETADEYLSGNLMHKHKIAKEANEQYLGYFEANVKALEALIEPDIDPDDIYVTLGSPWVPTDIIDDFIIHLLDDIPDNVEQYYGPEYAVRHDEITGVWEIPQRNRFRKHKHHGKYEELNYSVWGTKRMDMLYLMENILNMKTLSISEARDAAGKIRVINKDETVKILEKQEKMIAEFQKWVWQSENRKRRLQSAYCRKYGNIRKRTFDGSFLEFPGMNEEISLYPYQKNSVARILFSPNTLLAHDVGAGKTYVMIAAGMELRRLGKSKKNLYVVPNNIIGQWEDIFHKMYPQAKLLIVTNHNFNQRKRSETLQRIIQEDFDGILMTYSCFDMLSLSKRYYMDLYKKRLQLLDKASQVFYSPKKINSRRQAMLDTLTKIQESYVDNICDVAFDELGINTLFVDEAHNYKNVGVETSISRVLGAGGRGSKKCQGMMDKVHCVQRQNNGGRVILATGTPITNSITDIFVMQKYLQEGELEFLGLHNFDNWAGMFAEKTTDFEIDVDTNSYHLATRFARFCNIPELTSVLSSIADFYSVERGAGLPEFDGYSDSLREGSQDFKEYLMDISNRADDVRQKRVSRFEDNLLKITSDGRKAALDMRLIDMAFGLDPDSKVMRCAENIMEVYDSTRDIKGIQLVFCDSSTPKAGFNLYDELKNLLIAMGMPAGQIAFVHDAATESQRELMFRDLRAGRLSVMIGSTFKMGIGVNVQDRLAALHHLDVPWRPADMVQREGRILRQGNRNKKVRIFRYITRESFDAYSWQLLETKQRFISQILSGRATVRSGADVDEAVLNYAEVKALAVGNPLIKKRVEVSNELDKYRILQRDYLDDRKKKEQELRDLPAKIDAQKARIEACKQDIADAAEDKTDYDAIPYLQQKSMREAIYEAVMTHRNQPEERKVMTYRGFEIVVPAYMVPREPNTAKQKENDAKSDAIPYIFLKRNGTYLIEIESESGISVRLNHFIARYEKQTKDKITKEVIRTTVEPSGLEKSLERYEEVLQQYEMRREVLDEELKRNDGFVESILRLKEELNQIDEELGVKTA